MLSTATHWDRPVSELAKAATPENLTPGQIERHRIYSLLLMALVFNFHNGNKRGPSGNYPGRVSQRLPNGTYDGGNYLGHNIGCLAVDGDGLVIDFGFNHNELFNSSVEHAESRLLRRVFSLTQIYENWHVRKRNEPPKSEDYSNILSDVSIYTSLESCAQCSGMMALARVKEVIYLQRDTGAHNIGNILWNLWNPPQTSPQSSSQVFSKAPRPIPADLIGFRYFDTLNAGYEDFCKTVKDDKFYIPSKGDPDVGTSITSFLCTDAAKVIFGDAAQEFFNMQLQHANFKYDEPSETKSSNVLTNEEALQKAKEFYDYAAKCGHRGTPHKL